MNGLHDPATLADAIAWVLQPGAGEALVVVDDVRAALATLADAGLCAPSGDGPPAVAATAFRGKRALRVRSPDAVLRIACGSRWDAAFFLCPTSERVRAEVGKRSTVRHGESVVIAWAAGSVGVEALNAGASETARIVDALDAAEVPRVVDMASGNASTDPADRVALLIERWRGGCKAARNSDRAGHRARQVITQLLDVIAMRTSLDESRFGVEDSIIRKILAGARERFPDVFEHSAADEAAMRADAARYRQ